MSDGDATLAALADGDGDEYIVRRSEFMPYLFLKNQPTNQSINWRLAGLSEECGCGGRRKGQKPHRLDDNRHEHQSRHPLPASKPIDNHERMSMEYLDSEHHRGLKSDKPVVLTTFAKQTLMKQFGELQKQPLDNVSAGLKDE